MGYSRRIESNRRQICASVQTKGRWMFGSQKPPSSSGIVEVGDDFANGQLLVLHERSLATAYDIAG